MLIFNKFDAHYCFEKILKYLSPVKYACSIFAKLKGQFHGSAHVHIIYSPVHALLQGPLFHCL